MAPLGREALRPIDRCADPRLQTLLRIVELPLYDGAVVAKNVDTFEPARARSYKRLYQEALLVAISSVRVVSRAAAS